MAETKAAAGSTSQPQQPAAVVAPAAAAPAAPPAAAVVTAPPAAPVVAAPKATRYVVTGAAVVLPLEGGSEKYLYRGATVGDGFTAAGIKHALAVGLIKKAK